MFIIQRYLARKKLREMLSEEKEEEELKDEDEDSQAAAEKTLKVATKNVAIFRTLSCKTRQSSENDIQCIVESLTVTERKALKLSWLHLGKKRGPNRSTQLLAPVFERTVKRNPHINKLLTKCHKGSEDSYIYQHVKKLATLLDCIILPETYRTPEYCPSVIGRRHTPLRMVGFKADFWETFGECFSEVMSTNDTVRATNAARAWNILIAVLTDRLRAAYEQETKLAMARKEAFIEEENNRASSSGKYLSNQQSLQSDAMTQSIIENELTPVELRDHHSNRRSICVTGAGCLSEKLPRRFSTKEFGSCCVDF